MTRERALALARESVFVAVALVVVVAAQLEAWLSLDGTRWVMALLAAAQTMPLLAQRRFPLAAPLASFGGLALAAGLRGEEVYGSTSFFFAALLAVWAIATGNPLRPALAGLGLSWALVFWVDRFFPRQTLDDYLWPIAIFTLTWLAGFTLNYRFRQVREVQAHAARLELEREERAFAAVAEERQRIARELHDVVAHSISVMTIQAGAVRRLLHDDQARERDALQTIEDTGRQALGEMRRVVGMLRQPTEQAELHPQPGLSRLDDLVTHVRQAGLPVRYEVRGEPVQLPPGVDLSAFRIVQEALTNALKHAGPARAEVHVSYGDVLELEVVNDGRVEGDGAENGVGHGLVGMRERVALYGGTLEVGADARNRYVVRARIPLAEAPAS